MEILLIIGGTIVTILTTCIGERLIKLVNQKIRSENIRRILNNIKDIVLDTVRATEQTYVKEYKKSDKFHKEIQKEVLNLAKNKVIELLSKEIKDYIKSTNRDIDSYIVNKIEATIYDLKH